MTTLPSELRGESEQLFANCAVRARAGERRRRRHRPDCGGKRPLCGDGRRRRMRLVPRRCAPLVRVASPALASAVPVGHVRSPIQPDRHDVRGKRAPLPNGAGLLLFTLSSPRRCIGLGRLCLCDLALKISLLPCEKFIPRQSGANTLRRPLRRLVRSAVHKHVRRRDESRRVASLLQRRMFYDGAGDAQSFGATDHPSSQARRTEIRGAPTTRSIVTVTCGSSSPATTTIVTTRTTYTICIELRDAQVSNRECRSEPTQWVSAEWA